MSKPKPIFDGQQVSTRAKNVLAHLGIETLAEYRDFPCEQVARTKNAGLKVFNELEQLIGRHPITNKDFLRLWQRRHDANDDNIPIHEWLRKRLAHLEQQGAINA